MDLERLQIDDQHRPRRSSWLVRLTVSTIVGVVILSAGWLLIGMFPGISPLTGLGATPVETVLSRRIDPGQGAELTTANGHLVARRTASLGTRVLGRLARLYVEPGDRVAADQILAEIEHDDLDAEVAHAAGELLQAEAALRASEEAYKLSRLQAMAVDKSRMTLDKQKAEASAQHAQAQRELIRSEDLWKSRTISERDLDQARTRVAVAQARLAAVIAELDESDANLRVAEQASALAAARVEVNRSRLPALEAMLARDESFRENAFIRAPFAGIVVRKEAEVGEIVAPSPGGDTLSRSAVLTMADFSTLELEVDVFERDIGLLETGTRALIRLDAYPDRTNPGQVRLIRPTADRAKGTVQVKVAFDTIPGYARPEMSGNAVFLRRDASDEVPLLTRIFVPAAAVDRVAGNPRVWLIKSGTARSRAVKLGDSVGREVEVLDGLEGGETLILPPFDALTEGLEVQPAV